MSSSREDVFVAVAEGGAAGKGGKSSETAPASQSRLSAESGPPSSFVTARDRSGQRWRA